MTMTRDDQQMSTGFKFPDLPTMVGGRAGDRGVKTMTKAELAEALFDRLGLNKREAKDMRGVLDAAGCEAEERRVWETLAALDLPHWREYLAAWGPR